MKRVLNIQKRMKIRTAGMLAILFPALILLIACEKSNNQNYNPPADHTISRGGYMHKSGLSQPLANCVACHGSDLRGGTTGVSCYECHNQKW